LSCVGLLANLTGTLCAKPGLVTGGGTASCLAVVVPNREPLGDFFKSVAAGFCPTDFAGDAGRDMVGLDCEVAT